MKNIGNRKSATWKVLVGALAIVFAGSGHALASGNAAAGSNNLVAAAAGGAAATAGTGEIGGAIGGAFGFASSGEKRLASLSENQYGTRSVKYLNLREQGRAAGSGELKFNVWLNGAYTWVEKTDTGGEFEGNVANLVGGVDYKITKKAIVGVSVGYENVDIDTNFNNGSLEADGISVAGYAGINLKGKRGPDILLTGVAGYTFLDYDTTRNNGANTGSFDGGRYFLNGSIAANWLLKGDKLRLTPKMSLLYVQETQDAYSENTGLGVQEQLIALGRFSLGAEVGYRIKSRSVKFIEPYAKLFWEWDWEHEDGENLGGGNFSSDDSVGFVAGGGINFVMNDRFSARIEGSANAIGRDNLDIYTVSGLIRYRF